MSYDPHQRVTIPRPIVPPALALGPVEAFVLSKIDGKRSVSDLAAIVGVGRDELEAILGRLEAAGAVVVDTLDVVDVIDAGEMLDGSDLLDAGDLEEIEEAERHSSRPTTPSSDDPFERFDRATSPGEAPPYVMVAAGGTTPRRPT